MSSGFHTKLNKKQLKSASKFIEKLTFIVLDDEISSNDVSQSNETIKETYLSIGLEDSPKQVVRFNNISICINELRNMPHKRIFLIILRKKPLKPDENSTLLALPNVKYTFHFRSDSLRNDRDKTNSNGIIQTSLEDSWFTIFPLNLITLPFKKLKAGIKNSLTKLFLIEILQQSECSDEEKKEFINFCIETYRDDQVRMKQIQEYQRKHLEKTPIYLFTEDTFIHRILSKTLRESNLKSIFHIRYYLCGLYKQLLNLYKLQLSTLLNGEKLFYRGKVISRNELKYFQKSIGKYAITNSYVSVSTDEKVAKMFSSFEQPPTGSKVSVLFCFQINVKNVSKPLAFIDDYSAKGTEEEVLQSIGIIFRVDKVRKISVSK